MNHIRIRPLLLLLFLPLIIASGSLAGVKSPAAFLGYDPGDRFTRHHEILAYFEHVAENSPMVTLDRYGETYQHRPLFAAFVSSEENIRARDTIRINNRRMTGLDPGEISGPSAAIVWLSYGLHGNESSSPEAAMLTLYELVSGEETAAGNSPDEVAVWLENTLVVIDPVLNPDGRERYVSWFEQTVGRRPDPRMEVREHDEPWPGGRSNHYYFDLNRDWAWQTQVESRQRIAFYNMWMPQVHADFHEMFTNDYFFPPSAEPYHAAITPWQREFQYKIGENHAAYFDERNERYFTREIFDLFYPGYGDTWPTFNGAIGMTYEQMGHGRAGTAMIRDNGDTLTLAGRLMNHHITGLSTVEVAAENSRRLREEFREYFRRAAAEPEGTYDHFVIGGHNHPDRLQALLDFLDRQEIRYHQVEEGRRMSGKNYLTGEEQSRRTDGRDVVIPLAQPKSALTRILFEPDPELADSNTYDVTAWALPYAYGLDAWAVDGRVRTTGDPVRTTTRYEPLTGPDTLPVDEIYAYAIPWGDVRDASFLSDLLQAGIRVRITGQPFTMDGRTFGPGSMVITTGENSHMEASRLRNLIDFSAAGHDRRVALLSTGRSDSGPDLGSPRLHLLEKPRVAIPAGEQVNPYNLGEIWHYFDYRLDYPLAMFHPDKLTSFPLDTYDVMILPNGRYLDNNGFDWDNVMNWVSDGGRLIAFPEAVRALAEREEFDIAIRDFENDDLTDQQTRFADRRRVTLSRQISGAVFQIALDDSHPLAYGLGTTYAALKRGAEVPELLSAGWNVGTYYGDDPVLAGWAGDDARKLQEEAMAIGTMQHGGGQLVLFADNPLFRGFWRNGELLFSNALFQVSIVR